MWKKTYTILIQGDLFTGAHTCSLCYARMHIIRWNGERVDDTWGESGWVVDKVAQPYLLHRLTSDLTIYSLDLFVFEGLHIGLSSKQINQNYQDNNQIGKFTTEKPQHCPAHNASILTETAHLISSDNHKARFCETTKVAKPQRLGNTDT